MENHYEKNCQDWRNRFLKMDLAERMAVLPELKREGGCLTLRHFHRKLGIRLEDGRMEALEDARPVSHITQLNVYTLLGYASPGARLLGQWMPFERLRHAAPFGPAFRRGVIKTFAATFSGHADRLEDAMERLGGRRLAHADVGFELKAFECIPVRFLFWEGDDEFPAQGNLLFDQSATDFIHVESVVSIATEGLRQLAREADLPLARGALD